MEPLDFEVTSCTGELVHVTGTLDVDLQLEINANGSTFVEHATPHLTAVGEVSGTVYNATGHLP